MDDELAEYRDTWICPRCHAVHYLVDDTEQVCPCVDDELES